MMNADVVELVAGIIASAPRHMLVGRIRLQKIAYLLKQLGAPIPFQFGYYHYGPYASEMEKAAYDAKERGLINEKIRARKSDGAQYSIFMASDDTEKVKKLPSEYADRVAMLAEIDPVILELAATAHWLSEVERVGDWEKEIRLRKTWKVDNGRLDEARKLLKELGLPPAESAENPARA